MLKKDERFKFVCPECGCEEYTIEEMESTVKDEDTGEVIGKYPSYIAICKDCGQPVYVDYIEKENRRIASEFERNHYNILSTKEIAKLPRRYNVSREDFMTILKIGTHHKIDENTWEVFDIWAGDVPNDEEEKRLEKVKEDPEYFIKLLNEAKSMLEDEVYERALKRAEQLK